MALHPRLRERPHRAGNRAGTADEPTPRERVLALREAHPHLSSRALAARARVPRSSAQRWLREAAEEKRTAERASIEAPAALLASDRAGAGVAGSPGGSDAAQASSAGQRRSERDPEWVPDETGVPPALGGRHPQRSGPGDPFVAHPRDRGLPGWTNPWLR